MNELIQAVTRAANAIAVYYEKQAGVQNLPLTTAAVVEPTVIETKVRKPRATKAEVPAAPEAPKTEPVSTAMPILNEVQSEERLKVVGEAFVQRFSKQGDAVEEVKKTITDKFKVTRLRDLVHAQRVELIAALEARIREIDSKQTQSAPAAAAPVGLGI